MKYTMPTYTELQAQIAALKKQAEAARAAELEAVIADIRIKVAEYGITPKDIFGHGRGRPKKQEKQGVAAKYRDPKTGTTWSGRGRAPTWIKNAKNRDKFLVND
jgi:DNA-binding protein H-NS